MNYKIIVLCVACFVAGRFGIPAYKYIVAHTHGLAITPVSVKEDADIDDMKKPDKPAEPKEIAGKTVVSVNEQPEPVAPPSTTEKKETVSEVKETSFVTNEATNDKADKTTKPQVEPKPAITPSKVTTVNAAPKSTPTTVTTGDTTSENPMIKVLEKLEGQKK